MLFTVCSGQHPHFSYLILACFSFSALWSAIITTYGFDIDKRFAGQFSNYAVMVLKILYEN